MQRARNASDVANVVARRDAGDVNTLRPRVRACDRCLLCYECELVRPLRPTCRLVSPPSSVIVPAGIPSCVPCHLSSVYLDLSSPAVSNGCSFCNVVTLTAAHLALIFPRAVDSYDVAIINSARGTPAERKTDFTVLRLAELTDVEPSLLRSMTLPLMTGLPNDVATVLSFAASPHRGRPPWLVHEREGSYKT